MTALCNSTYECITGKAPYSFKSLTRTEQYLQSCEAWASVPLSFINNQNSVPQFYSNATDSNAIVQPPFSPALLPDSSLLEAENFCRNPDNDDKGAWCYVKDGNKYTKKYCKTPCTGIWACLFDRVGQYYQGKINKTETGVDCQRWDTPGQTFTASSFPDTTLGEASNYCRNPDSNPGGPWCYTDFATKKFGFCTLPVCKQTPPIPPLTTSPSTSLCQLTDSGVEYTGIVSTTKSGKTCLDWSIQSTNNPYFNRPQLFNVANMTEVKAYCRNPSRVLTGPWCYTSTGEEQCDIQKCFTTIAPTLPPGTRTVCRSTLEGVEYNGTVSVTAENITCLRWDLITNLIYKDSDFPEKSIRLADNYCRNPNKTNHIGTFCYVNSGGEAKEKPCVVPMCNTSQCRNTSEGYTYIGAKTTSLSGKTCLPWKTFITTIDPDVLPDNSVEDAKNYCRNPNKANNFDGPFCYVNNGGTNEPETCGINYCTPQCRNTPAGQEYAGIISYAGSLKCRTWEDVSNIQYRDPKTLNAATLKEASNYCRNPNNDTKGPWCYTEPQTVSYCHLPVCSPSGNCYTNSTAWAYTGTVNVTENNLPCVKWSSYDVNNYFGLPGPTFVKELFPDSSIVAANNYCRTPTTETQYKSRPWCYLDMMAIATTNPMFIPTQSFQYCNVTQCVITTTESTTATTMSPTTPTPTTISPTTPTISTISTTTIDTICRQTLSGVEYNGTVSVTAENVTCLRWNSIPNLIYRNCDFPENSISLANNYCRNPKTDHIGPFCYVNVSGSLVERPCVVPMCVTSPCRTTIEGYTYNGTKSTSESGKPCLPWKEYVTSIDPDVLPDNSVEDAKNYCRNPNKANYFGGPFCYVKKNGNSVPETCNINYCTTAACRSTLAGVEYNGTVSVTAENITCLRWDSIPNLIYKDCYFPESIDNANNYCRNPKQGHVGLFCYVKINGTTLEKPCVVPMCITSQCRATNAGYSFDGMKSTSKSGKTCLSWKTFISHIDPDLLPDKSVDDAKNYCRNPNRANSFDGPFCYVNNNGKSEPETCGINYCRNKFVSSNGRK